MNEVTVEYADDIRPLGKISTDVEENLAEKQLSVARSDQMIILAITESDFDYGEITLHPEQAVKFFDHALRLARQVAGAESQSPDA